MTEARIDLCRLHGSAIDLHELQCVLEAAPNYCRRVSGLPAEPGDARAIFSALPGGKSRHDKFVFGIHRGDRMIGCVDLVRGYPDDTTAWIGLLLIAEPWQHQGIGRRIYPLIEGVIRQWPGCDRVGIGVVRTNSEVLGFWHGMGFQPTGETKPYRCAAVSSESIVLEKRLGTTTATQSDPRSTRE